MAPSPRHRRALVHSAGLVALASLALPALTASAARPRVAFVDSPERVVQGSTIQVSVAAPAGSLCSLAVRYRGGSRQKGLAPQRAAGGRATWAWKVALGTHVGTGRMSASCGRAGRATRTLVVIGQLVPPRISVVKDGFSVRPHDFGGGSDVSYGVILHNRSPNADALDVNVLVNFVLANNRLLGSQSTNVPVLRAGATYALGTSMSFPGAAPIARLEVVVQVGQHQHASGGVPAIANVVIEPDQSKPVFVGDVAGEIVNANPKLTLQGAQLSAVVLDRQGNVIGGGNGSSSFTLPPGTRAVFKLTSGFNAIPMAGAASALVSVVPTWKQPAS